MGVGVEVEGCSAGMGGVVVVGDAAAALGVDSDVVVEEEEGEGAVGLLSLFLLVPLDRCALFASPTGSTWIRHMLVGGCCVDGRMLHEWKGALVSFHQLSMAVAEVVVVARRKGW